MRIVQIIALYFLLTGCLNEPDCVITSTNLVKIHFKVDSKTLLKIKFTKVNVSGLDKNYYEGVETSSVELPVDPEGNEVTFTFYFNNRVETMKVTYNRQSQVISINCGAFTNYTGLAVPETTFDLINITNNNLLLNATTNIDVFIQ